MDAAQQQQKLQKLAERPVPPSPWIRAAAAVDRAPAGGMKDRREAGPYLLWLSSTDKLLRRGTLHPEMAALMAAKTKTNGATTQATREAQVAQMPQSGGYQANNVF